MTLAEFSTWDSPLGVKGMSLRPVYRPEMVHSVSPMKRLEFKKSHWADISPQMQKEEERSKTGGFAYRA